MGVFNEIGRRVSNAGQKTVQKTKDLADITKLSAAIGDEEKKINGIYKQIGELYFEKNQSNPSADFLDLLGSVKDSKRLIEDIKQQIQDIKKVRKCPSCGLEIPDDAVFCGHCGAHLVQPARPEGGLTVCTNCGKEIAAESAFCGYCGTPVPKTEEPAKPNYKICINCGQKISLSSDFCFACGHKQPGKEAAESVPEEPAFAETADADETEAPLPDLSGEAAGEEE